MAELHVLKVPGSIPSSPMIINKKQITASLKKKKKKQEKKKRWNMGCTLDGESEA